MNENELSKLIVNTAFNIHNQYGPGLYESVYEEVMFYELMKLNLPLKRQAPIPWFMNSSKWKSVSEQT
jgi:GxxExxY protein